MIIDQYSGKQNIVELIYVKDIVLNSLAYRVHHEGAQCS